MFFSLIVPIYNVQDCLKRCVDSLVNQTFRDIEIILVDDGSTDNSPYICDAYAKTDPRIKVLHKENGGASDSRNEGLFVALGDYVLFVDSDDYIELDTCERFAVYLNKGCDILVGDAEVEGGVYNTEHIVCNEILEGTVYYKKALSDNKAPVAVWLNVYRRCFLIENGIFFKSGFCVEDVEFTPRVFLEAKTVYCTRIKFYHYVIRDNSVSTKKDKRKNFADLYSICADLEKRFSGLRDDELRIMLMDSLVSGYLALFQISKGYQYGAEYIHKDFCLRNAYATKTKLKSKLFNMSPGLYWHINALTKVFGRRG